MNYQLTHIFDRSACLTRRQIKSYINNELTAEECHAAEHHLNNCPLCGEAIDGLEAHQQEAIEILAMLNPAFLKEHFSRITPQIHYNSVAPVSQPMMQHPAKPRKQTLYVNTFLAVLVFAGLGILGYLELTKPGKLLAKEAPTPPQLLANVVSTPASVSVDPAKTTVTFASVKESAVKPEHSITTKTTAIKKAITPIDRMAHGQEQYNKKNWQAALTDFRHEMNSTDKNHSHEAAMMAAQCYEQMGKTDEAHQVLQNVVADKGPDKRAARRMLRQMKNAEE